MDEKEKRDILKLYPEFNKVYGPYERLDGRKVVVFYNAEQKTSSRQFAKVKLEVKINRRLVKNETVDHIDENFRNDDLDNLQVLSNIDNAKKSSRASGRIVQIDQDQVCIICKTVFRSIRIYQTCGSPTCKARNRSAISKSLGLIGFFYRYFTYKCSTQYNNCSYYPVYIYSFS